MLTKERIEQGITLEWTAEDRLIAIAALLPGLQADIYAGNYSAVGRPNITSLQYLIGLPASDLESTRETLEPLVRDLLKGFP
jgi:hypothetical protein